MIRAVTAASLLALASIPAHAGSIEPCNPDPEKLERLVQALRRVERYQDRRNGTTAPLPSEVGNRFQFGFSWLGEGLYLGPQLGTEVSEDDSAYPAKVIEDRDWLAGHGVGAVLDMRSEGHDEGAVLEEAGIAYRRIPVVDGRAPTLAQLIEAVQWVRKQRARGVKVYLHCRAGLGRSATVAIAVFMSDGLSLREALKAVERRRAICVRWNAYDLLVLRCYAAVMGLSGLKAGPVP